MTHPLHLRHGTSGDGTDAVVVSPESAGWAYSGLRIVELAPGATRDFSTGPDELIVLPLSGSATVTAGGSTFSLAGRADPFAGPTDFVYVGLGTPVTIASTDGARIALPSARADEARPVAYGAAADVPIELRGAGGATRQLNNFCDPRSTLPDKLLAVECITPCGNWSSWPPHKHDTVGTDEAVLEELYYFEVASAGTGTRRMGEGFAVHRLYTDDGQIDLCEEVRQGDVVLIPRGYHGPSVTAPGYDLYYLKTPPGKCHTTGGPPLHATK